MKLSIIFAVLNSHEVVRRQLLHLRNLDLPNDIEIIIADDGSEPSLDFPNIKVRNLTIFSTGDTRQWTWAVARNAAARRALGNYFLMTDIDFILSRELIDACYKFSGDKIQFRREFGVLDELGCFTQDLDIMRQYGLLEERIQRKGLSVPPHPNSFCIRKDLFWDIGGFPEDRIGKSYPQGEDRWFKGQWSKLVAKGIVTTHAHRPLIYMFPNGKFCGDADYNPFGLFHSLSRKIINA